MPAWHTLFPLKPSSPVPPAGANTILAWRPQDSWPVTPVRECAAFEAYRRHKKAPARWPGLDFTSA